jgi:hypothetical protein
MQCPQTPGRQNFYGSISKGWLPRDLSQSRETYLYSIKVQIFKQPVLGSSVIGPPWILMRKFAGRRPRVKQEQTHLQDTEPLVFTRSYLKDLWFFFTTYLKSKVWHGWSERGSNSQMVFPCYSLQCYIISLASIEAIDKISMVRPLALHR